MTAPPGQHDDLIHYLPRETISDDGEAAATACGILVYMSYGWKAISTDAHVEALRQASYYGPESTVRPTCDICLPVADREWTETWQELRAAVQRRRDAASRRRARATRRRRRKRRRRR